MKNQPTMGHKKHKKKKEQMEKGVRRLNGEEQSVLPKGGAKGECIKSQESKLVNLPGARRATGARGKGVKGWGFKE